ncbi:serine/arginine repetitive matrix protein 2-like isoform X2 [Mytilus trossulus]|uniref:serine/arginine repetitive matrix protein 2-like isoform X2 n=1 Tax=Mytilus trossulus TaxID=6551 RepID=UPI0030069FDD
MKTQKKNKMVLVRWQGNGSSDYDGKEHYVKKNSLVNQDTQVGEEVIVKWFSKKWKGVLIKDVKEGVLIKDVKEGVLIKDVKKGVLIKDVKEGVLIKDVKKKVKRKESTGKKKGGLKQKEKEKEKGKILCIGNSREDRTNLQHASSTSGQRSPVAKGQTIQTLQTRKSSPTLKTPTRKRQSIQLELSPSEQYTSTGGQRSPVAKGQTLQTRKSSPTLKTPTRKRPSIQLELSPSEQYTSTSGLWSPVAKGQTLQTLQTRKSSPTLKTPTRKRPSIQLELSPSEQYTSTSGQRSPVAKGQTLQTLQTRKSSPTLKTPTRKRPSIQLELSPSEQYTSTSGLRSTVAKGQTLQTLQTRKSSPTLKTPTRKRPSIQLELSPSEQYTRVTKIWSPIDCISPQSKNQSLHLVWPPQDQYTFADDKAVTTSSYHSSTSGLWSPVPKVPKGHTSLGHLKTRKTPSKFELSPSEQYTSTSGLWSPVAKGQTLQTLQTRKSSPTLKTPTRKRPSIQLELSPSEQYTSTSGLWSPVAKGQTLQTLQTRKSSPTLKTPTRKRPSIQLELSPSEQYTSTSGLWSPVAKGQTLQTRKSLPTTKAQTRKTNTPSKLEWSPSEQYTGQAQKCLYGTYTASPQTSPITEKEYKVYKPLTKLFQDSGEGHKFQFGSMYQPPPQAVSEKRIGQNQTIPKQLFQDLGEDSRQKSQGKMAISIKETLQQRQWSLIPKLKGAPALARELLKKMVPEEELFKASFSGKNKDGNKLNDVQMEMIKETVCDVYSCDSHTEMKCLWKMCKTSLVQMLKHTRTKGCKNTVVPKF